MRTLPFLVAFGFSAVSFFTPGEALPQTDIWDKASHAAMFAALVLTGWLAELPRRGLVFGLFGYAVLSEVLQAILPIERTGDWHDVLADTVGTALGVAVMLLLPTPPSDRG